jgi:hypothetical protein
MIGRLPDRALRLVKEWAVQHQDELLENWHRLQAGQGAVNCVYATSGCRVRVAYGEAGNADRPEGALR